MTTFICCVCKKANIKVVCNRVEDMELHLAIEHFQLCILECAECPGAHFPTDSSLASHTRDKHNKNRTKASYVLNESSERARRQLLLCLINCAQVSATEVLPANTVPVQNSTNFIEEENSELISIIDSGGDGAVAKEQSKRKRLQSTLILPDNTTAIEAPAVYVCSDANAKEEIFENQRIVSSTPEIRVDIDDSLDNEQTTSASVNQSPVLNVTGNDGGNGNRYTLVASPIFNTSMPFKDENTTSTLKSQQMANVTFSPSERSPGVPSIESTQPSGSQQRPVKRKRESVSQTPWPRQNENCGRRRRSPSPAYSVGDFTYPRRSKRCDAGGTHQSRKSSVASSVSTTKRPTSAYMHFRKDMKDRIMKAAAGSKYKFAEIAKSTWDSLSPAEKSVYIEKERLERSEYERSIF